MHSQNSRVFKTRTNPAFPFKECRTHPSSKVFPSKPPPPPPKTLLFSYRQLFLFPLPTLKGQRGEVGEEGGGGSASGKCKVEAIFP